jgi:Domain of unknown function (DUF1998)
VPVGNDDVPGLQPVGVRLAYTVATDRQLVAANKGQVVNEASQGFWVCDHCGSTHSETPAAAPHERPYRIEFTFNQPKPPNLCSGRFHNVFLGHIFKTDLLLLRITLVPPMAIDTNDSVVLLAIEDALYSTSEALRLAASRHPQLDLDPSEFGSGFWVVPAGDRQQLHLDVYLYDTLSGGAGYAELAGRFLEEILADVLTLLERCAAQCDQSCESCLRHYRLDRFVGAQLLRYALSGQPPAESPTEYQARNLAGLMRLLELDGFRCTAEADVAGQRVPLEVERDGVVRVIGTQSGLLAANGASHSLDELFSLGVRGRVLNDYILRRNPPGEHQVVWASFDRPPVTEPNDRYAPGTVIRLS